jgi:hypothetical protein
MEPVQPPEGELHQFHMVSPDGEIPVSITVLVRFGRSTQPGLQPNLNREPISADEVLTLHDALRSFDGNFIHAFRTPRSSS